MDQQAMSCSSTVADQKQSSTVCQTVQIWKVFFLRSYQVVDVYRTTPTKLIDNKVKYFLLHLTTHVKLIFVYSNGKWSDYFVCAGGYQLHEVPLISEAHYRSIKYSLDQYTG